MIVCLAQLFTSAQHAFEVLLDCTGFSAINEIPITWIVQLLAIIPTIASQKFIRLMIFGPTSSTKQYIRSLGRFIPFERFDSRRTLTFSSLSKFEDIFANVEKVLPASTRLSPCFLPSGRPLTDCPACPCSLTVARAEDRLCEHYRTAPSQSGTSCALQSRRCNFAHQHGMSHSVVCQDVFE